jgi:hypothetical protein
MASLQLLVGTFVSSAASMLSKLCGKQHIPPADQSQLVQGNLLRSPDMHQAAAALYRIPATGAQVLLHPWTALKLKTPWLDACSRWVEGLHHAPLMMRPGVTNPCHDIH